MRRTFSLTVSLFLLALLVTACDAYTDQPATNVTSTSATVSPTYKCDQGDQGVRYIRYTTDKNLPMGQWQKTPDLTYGPCTSSAQQRISTDLTGLTPGTTYWAAPCGTDTAIQNPGPYCNDSTPGGPWLESNSVPSGTSFLSFTTQAAPPPPPSGTQGLVRPFTELRSDMDTYLDAATSGDAAKRAWLQRFERLRIWMNGSSYPGDRALNVSPRYMPVSWKYADAQVATYTSSALTADEHYLWDKPPTDPTRKRLFVDFGCNGTTCTQYAADVGNPNTRARYVNGLAAQATKAGGVWMDDVNFQLDRVVSNGAGTFVRPWNPRTGTWMTQDDWADGMLQLVRDTKAALPDPLEVVMNTVAWHGPGILNIPQAKAALGVADGWEIEGNTVSQNAIPYKAASDYAHSQGTFVVHDIQRADLGAGTMTYSLAVYLCMNAGRDFYGYLPGMRPSNSWDPLWDKDLGAATSECVQGADGIYRRSFERGSVTVNPANLTGSVN